MFQIIIKGVPPNYLSCILFGTFDKYNLVFMQTYEDLTSSYM